MVQIVEYTVNHTRRDILGTQPVTPTVDLRRVLHTIEGIQNYLWDDLFVGWTCGMLISFDVCCGTDLWDCTMLKGNRF